MRILIATGQWFPDFRGGSGRVAADTARALARRGHEVLVLAPKASGLPEQETDGNLTVRRVIARGFLPLVLTDVLQTRRHARHAALARRFDLLVSHQVSNFVGLRGARLDLPIAFVFHASIVRELRFLRRHLSLGRRLAKAALGPPLSRFERTTASRATRILVLSRFSRSLIEEDYPAHAGRVTLVPGGVDTTYFHPGEGRTAARSLLGVNPGAPLLLSARRFEPRMGLEELLRALPLLERKDVTLALVGRGMLEDALRQLASELGVRNRVKFVGGVSDEELRSWYRAADLFVLPTVAYEGFGLATAEALACGTPVVGTPVGATPELLDPIDTRLVAAGSDPRALAAAIDRALPLSTPELGARCRDYAERTFEWERAIVPWEAAFEDAVATGARERRVAVKAAEVSP